MERKLNVKLDTMEGRSEIKYYIYYLYATILGLAAIHLHNSRQIAANSAELAEIKSLLQKMQYNNITVTDNSEKFVPIASVEGHNEMILRLRNDRTYQEKLVRSLKYLFCDFSGIFSSICIEINVWGTSFYKKCYDVLRKSLNFCEALQIKYCVQRVYFRFKSVNNTCAVPWPLQYGKWRRRWWNPVFIINLTELERAN